MKRKPLLLILGCLATLLLAGYVTLRLTAPRHGITFENFKAIKNGMTEKEVEGILGVPAGVYSSSKFIFLSDGSGLEKKGESKEWVGEDFGICVWFNDGRVEEVVEGLLVISNESFLAKLRRWLGM